MPEVTIRLAILMGSFQGRCCTSSKNVTRSPRVKIRSFFSCSQRASLVSVRSNNSHSTASCYGAAHHKQLCAAQRDQQRLRTDKWSPYPTSREKSRKRSVL